MKPVQFSGTGGTFLGKAKDTSSMLLNLYFLMQNLGCVVWQRGGCAWKWEVIWNIAGALTKESEVIHRRKYPRQRGALPAEATCVFVCACGSHNHRGRKTLLLNTGAAPAVPERPS